MWDKILQYLKDNKDALDFLFGSGIVLAVLGGLFTFGHWLIKEYRLRRIRTNDNFPFKIIPPNSNVAKEILGGADDDPLADRNIPYQQRIQGRNTRRELEELIEDHRWVLIVGRTGLGKTREAVQLAQSLNNEGWTILYLTREAWLDAPAKLPNKVPEGKLLFLLDDLNKKCFSSKAEIRPDARESLTLPIYEPFQTRLQRTLEAFDTFCGKSEIRVIATARNEKLSEFDELSEWDKMGWTNYDELWEKFQLVDLSEPDKTAQQKLLAETAGKAEILIQSEELPTLAKRNDGTFRNLVENLSSSRIEGFVLSSENFRDTLKGTWEKRYHKAKQKYPEASNIYDAIEIISLIGIKLKFSNVLNIATIIATNNVAKKIRFRRRCNFALKQLAKTENLLEPRDGQIEAKGYRIDIDKYLPVLYKPIHQIAYMYMHDDINGLLTYGLDNFLLGLVPKSIFDSSKKLSRIDKFICQLLGLSLSIHNAGVAYARAGFLSQAETIIHKALELKTTNPIIKLFGKSRIAYSWGALGSIHLASGHHDKAIQAYQKVIELNPKLILAWLELGDVYRKLNHYDEAVQSFKKAIKYRPKNASAWNRLGNVYYDINNIEEAINAYKKAIELYPKGDIYWANLGIAYQSQGQLREAIKAFCKSLEINPKYSYSILSLALCYKGIAENKEAEQLINSVESFIKNEENYFQACFYVARGDVENGLLYLKKGLNNNNTSKAWARKDPNFEIIRNDPRFKELVEKEYE